MGVSLIGEEIVGLAYAVFKLKRQSETQKVVE